jgi:phosphoribosylformimino-5-aminoimidazole carboxamide ribotide isomerase
MLIFPAIDLRGGKVVRLSQGDFDRMTVYAEDPLAVAGEFARLGAEWLHVVDLDGAKDGNPQNRAIAKALCGLPLRVQMGGGMRTEADVEEALAMGVSRVILGTAAVTNFPMVERLAAKHGEKLAVGVDVREGRVAIHGWQSVSELTGADFCRRLRDVGVGTVIYTDISKDGELKGTNLAAYQELAGIEGLQVIASGGVSFETELVELRRMNLYGVILGKALYAGKLSLARCVAIAKGEADIC